MNGYVSKNSVHRLTDSLNALVYDRYFRQRSSLDHTRQYKDKNSSGDEIANVNFYAVRPEAIPEFAVTTFKVIQRLRDPSSSSAVFARLLKTFLFSEY